MDDVHVDLNNIESMEHERHSNTFTLASLLGACGSYHTNMKVSCPSQHTRVGESIVLCTHKLLDSSEGKLL